MTQQKDQPIHELTVPDDLIAWGKDPDRARRWQSPWAHIVERMMQRHRERPMNTGQTSALLARLTALCVEAIRAQREDLLLGIDLYTAGWLGLEVEIEMKDGDPVVLGRDFSYGEMQTIVEAGPDCVTAARKAKELLADVFPRAKISAMIDTREAQPRPCESCGRSDAKITLDLDPDSKYCSGCWSDLTRRFDDDAKAR